MKIRFVGVNGAIVIPDLGGQVIEPGAVFEVSDVMGGRPPAPRIAEAMEELRVATADPNLHHVARALREEILGLDYGAGLLAQDTNFVPAGTPKPKPEPKD